MHNKWLIDLYYEINIYFLTFQVHFDTFTFQTFDTMHYHFK